MFRWFRWIGAEMIFPIWRYKDGLLNRFAKMMFQKMVRATVKDPVLAEKVIPKYAMGCKRICVSDEYFQSMNDKRYKLDIDPIISFTENGIKTQSAHHDLDIVIYATGFQIVENFNFVLNPFGAKNLSDKQRYIFS